MPNKRDVEASSVQFITEKHPNKKGIIYCIARNKTEEVAMKLRAQHLDARHFNAGIADSDADRKRILQLWQMDDCKVIMGTIAFAMGVDKADG
jgi:superfamily II DNA helicase RecQ